MADPMTQSAQISSSHGLNDGRSKESKFSDSFFSSSSVSLIQSPQEKQVALDSEKPSEGVPTSLRFSSQPSFSPGTYGNDSSVTLAGVKDRSFQEKRELFESSLVSQKRDSSPIKISPVSERIRALEALAAKQNDSDWNDAGFNFRERHYEKSNSEMHGVSLRSSVKKKPTSSEQDSPESPFEILGDSRRGSDFEDTADWMKAHLPPAPHFNIDESDFGDTKAACAMPECPSEIKSKDADVQRVSSPFVGVPDEFMDNTSEVSKQASDDSHQSKQGTTEDETEFELRFLPTAYMWEKQEKPHMDTQEPLFVSESLVSEITSSAAPLDCCEGSSLESVSLVPQVDSNAKQQSPTLGVATEGVEMIEADSSGESDDTVIEDASDVTNVTNGDAVKFGFSADKQMIPSQQTKPGLQVPIINVIETEDQLLSDYEVEDEEDEDDGYQIMQEPATKAPQSSEDLSDNFVSEFDKTAPKMEDLSSTERIADSDGENSQKHKIINDDITNDLIDQTSLSFKNHTLEDSHTESTMPQNTDEPSKESVSNVKSNETTDVVSDLPPNYEDLSSDFESSEIDAHLDHYTSPELALKDQLHSGVFALDNEDTNEPMKANPPQQSQTCTVPSQQSDEKIDVSVAEFDETVNQSNQNYDDEHKSSPSNILVDVPVELLPSQNNMPQLKLDDQNGDKVIMDSGIFPCSEDDDDYMTRHEVEVPSFQQNPLAQFPALHNDLSSSIIDVISDCAPSDLTEADKIIQVNDPHEQISPETRSKPESTETESKLNEYPIVQIDRSDALDTQVSEEPTCVPKSIEAESGKGQMYQCNDPVTQMSPETPNKNESTEAEASVTELTDSFVDFMRECLKSQQDKSQTSKDPAFVAQSSPAIIMHLEQECQTVCALKELGSSPEEQDAVSILKDIPISAKDSNTQPSLQSTSLICSNPSLCTLPNENQPDASLTDETEALDIWVAEAYHLAEHALALILTHLTVHDLVYWRDPKKSGLVFGISLLLLLSLAAFSVISIISYLLLALLCVTISFRIYKSVIQAVQKSNDGHPFKELMEKDVSLPPETFRKHVDACLTYINRALKQMSRLFLVEDLVDSLKLAVVMWLMTYVGAVFNGITILILVDILVFTVPPLYEKYKTQIDRYVDLARTHCNSVVTKIQEKLPKAAKQRIKTE